MTAESRSFALGLGSNLDEPLGWLDLAVQRIGELHGVSDLARSGDWESAAAGGPVDQRPYVNTALRITSSLSADELLPALLAIETDLGRVRTVRWGPRPIDIDLILSGPSALEDRYSSASIIATPWLTVPHPRWAVRQFVLQPLAELVPSWIDPLSGKTVMELRDQWLHWPHVFAFAGIPSEQIEEWLAEVIAHIPCLATDGQIDSAVGDSRPVLCRVGPADRVPHAVFVPPDWYPTAPADEFPHSWRAAPRVPLEFDPVGEIVAAVQAANPMSIRRLAPGG